MLKIERLSATSIRRRKLAVPALIRIRRARLMARSPQVQPLERLAEIYRAMNGDENAQRHVRLKDVAGLENRGTFEEFLRANDLPVYEEVLR